MEYLDEAQRRIDTGWCVEYESRYSEPWLLVHRNGRPKIHQQFKTEAEARAAYLAATKEEP